MAFRACLLPGARAPAASRCTGRPSARAGAPLRPPCALVATSSLSPRPIRVPRHGWGASPRRMGGFACRAAGSGTDSFDEFDSADWDDIFDEDLEGAGPANLDGMDYYSILGVAYDAEPKEIKKAYYRAVKVCHPDLSQDEAAATDFCSLLNEIYDVLKDPVRRATYDTICGFTASGVNPFMDTTSERDNVFVDEFTCIGCKQCANVAPDTFEMEPEYGRSRVTAQFVDPVPKVQEAIDTCPVDCIHWVTASQLTLLEEEMADMERVAVGIMMARQGSAGADVFMAANTRWEKRQNNLREKAQRGAAAQKKKASNFGQGGGFWGQGFNSTGRSSGSWDSMDEEANAAPLDPSVSAMTAEQARKWRDFQRARREAAENREAIAALGPGDE